NLFVLFMASSSQELKPPRNPGRFISYLHYRRRALLKTGEMLMAPQIPAFPLAVVTPFIL
ncbi:MAG: hypothetical protein CMK85_06665, partial [Pseudomonadales bacterium]|nr:hypothetical protein [Pseudomonadales bacterium]